MKWKRIQTKEKKSSNEQEDKANQSELLNLQSISAIQGLLKTEPDLNYVETIGLKMGCSSKSKHSKEPGVLHSKELASKKPKKVLGTEKPLTTKKSQDVVKRRRRTKIEMALSYAPRSPDVSRHTLEVGYNHSANLERRVRCKSSNMSDCMKGRGSFWILDDNLIHAVQEKMKALEKQNVQSPQEDIKPVPLLGLKCLPKQITNSMCLTMSKTIIQVSHTVPTKNKQTVNKESSGEVLVSECSVETSGLGQTDNDLSLNSLSFGLKESVLNKNIDVLGTVVGTVHCNSKMAVEPNLERILKKEHLVGEERARNISDTLEDVAAAGASSASVQVETQRNEICSDKLTKKPGNGVKGAEDEVELDSFGDVEVPDLETQSLENSKNLGHSQPLSRCNAGGLQGQDMINGDICKSKQMLTFPVVAVERISQECFKSGNDNHVKVIQTTNTSVSQADIFTSRENSVSLGRGHNITAEITSDHEKEVRRPSAHQETDGRRMRKRKRKQLFTRRKKCRDAGANATKLKYPSVDSRNSWTFQSSITDQVLSSCRLAEGSRASEMEISPEVESAASVLAMMSAGGRLFSAFQHGERHWDSRGPWQQCSPTASTGSADLQQAGKYMCEVCGHVFMDLALLKQHFSEHEKATKKSAHRKQLSHKPSLPTTNKMNVAQRPLGSAQTHFATLKSCTSINDSSGTQLQKVQNLRSKGFQSGHQPVTPVMQQAIIKDERVNQDADISQMGEVDHGGAIASTSVGSVINKKVVQEVVNLNEGVFGKNGTASKDISLNGDNGILQTAEVELGGTAASAGGRSVINQKVQDVVNLNEGLSDKNGVASASQTDVAGSHCIQALAGTQDTARISENEKENMHLANAEEIPMEVKDASCDSELVGKEPNQSDITALSYGTTNEFNAVSQRSAFGGSMSDVCSSESQSSGSTARDVQLVEHFANVQVSGSVTASESNRKASSGAVWDADVCCICNRKFSNVANMRKHIRMQHNSYRPHKCQICGKAFPYPSSLLEHMTSHSAAPRKLVCDMCGKAFVRQSGLRKHVKEQHETTRPHGCPLCDKRFVYLCALKEHQRSHSQERTFKCTKCECIFKQASNLLMHIRRRHQNACECLPGNCTCRPKAPRPLPSFSCVVCSKVFHARKQLEIHLDRHGGKKPLACQVCDKEFPNKFLLSKHRMKHQETKTYSCEVCNRNFLSKQSLKSHRESHAGIKPYQCESCGKQYTTKNSLKIHSIRHLEILPHACDKCNKTFALRTNLTKHMAVHTKEHVFVCCHCDKTFYCNTDLKKHVLHHEEQKTYVCSYCSQKFLHESNLKMHIVKHTGEKPHSCGVCGRCFSLKANLRRHTQMHMKKNGHIISESSIPMPGAYVVLGPE